MQRRPLLVAAAPLLLFLIALVLGCDGQGPTGRGTVIVGLTSELRAGVDVDRLHVVMRAGGNVIRDDVVTTGNGLLRFPAEFAFEDLDDGTAVEIALEAFRSGGDTPLLTRAASTEVRGDETLLLRVRLESECVILPGAETCAAPQTCIAGACGDPHVDASRLEPYSDDWATGEPDICKPAGAGEPIVIVGEGQGDYLPLEELQEAQVEAGPQGGHHIWVAIRMKNLKQSGSITSVSGRVPELGVEISPFNVIFTFHQDEGGFCKLFGLRFQLDQDIDIEELLGKVVDVKVTVSDPEGDVGVGERSVTLSPTIL